MGFLRRAKSRRRSASVPLLEHGDGRHAIKLAFTGWIDYALSWQEADCVKSVMRWLYRHESTGDISNEYLTAIVEDGVRAAVMYEAGKIAMRCLSDEVEELPRILRGKSTEAMDAAHLADARHDLLQATRYEHAAKHWTYAAAHVELLLIAARCPIGLVPSDAPDGVAEAQAEILQQMERSRRYWEWEASQR